MCDCNNGSCDRILSPIDRLHLRIEQLEKRVEWWEKYPTEVGNLIVRLEKMEKALSEEMAKTREMDSILAGVVKKVGYVSPPAPLDQKTLDDIVANPGDYEVKMVTPLGLASDIYIRKDELLKWLYKQIAKAERRNLEATNPSFYSLQEQCRAEGALATFAALKAHIQGHE